MTESLDRLGEQLRWLSEHVPGPDGSLLTVPEMCAWAERLAGVSISVPYASAMRQGRQRNPSAVKLGAIALVYSVPTDFFLRVDVEEEVKSLVLALSRAKRAEAEQLMAAASGDYERRLRAAVARGHGPPPSDD